MSWRVGLGFDVHPFSDDPDRRLVLAGVELDGPGLVGHSDADVIAHAVADALLGAAGLGDLGSLFPDDDPEWRNADSMRLLARVVEKVTGKRAGSAGPAATGARVGNVDCAVVLEAPRLAPHRGTMEQQLSAVVGAPVSVKPKRAEGLGAIGRGEGIACWAVALVTCPEPA
jgi:2-C-methyl-D-erythritol 2,4-cyclodiphosphate synthase